MKQDTFKLYKDFKLDLDLRQDIWVIMGPDEYLKTTVRGFECVLTGSENNKLSLIPKNIMIGQALIYLRLNYYEHDEDYMESIPRLRILSPSNLPIRNSSER